MREFDRGDFVGSVEFVDAIVEPAEDMGHHPDLEISWDTVKVTITTHSEGGLTDADFELAGRIDEPRLSAASYAMKLLHVVGTRPNFVKMAPVIAALRDADPDGRHVARPHRPALRPDDVGGLPRGARRSRARPHARGRLRQPRRDARRRCSSAIAPVHRGRGARTS